MESLRELFKIGFGPSSSHTMGPQRAASKIKEQYPNASRFEVELYGSLALSGKVILTDYIIKQTLGKQTIVRFKSDRLPYHPNGMKFYVYQDEEILDTITAYSIGGGTVEYEGSKLQQTKQIYPHKNLKEIIQYIEDNGISFYDYVLNYEDEHFKAYLFEVLDSMFTCVQNGLHHEGVIPGRLQLKELLKVCINKPSIHEEKVIEKDYLFQAMLMLFLRKMLVVIKLLLRQHVEQVEFYQQCYFIVISN